MSGVSNEASVLFTVSQSSSSSDESPGELFSSLLSGHHVTLNSSRLKKHIYSVGFFILVHNDFFLNLLRWFSGSHRLHSRNDVSTDFRVVQISVMLDNADDVCA